jgi:hypothetical protein
MIAPLGATQANTNGQAHFNYQRPQMPTPVIAAPTGPVTSPLSAPVPAGTPTHAIYQNSDGSQWGYNPATSEWQQLSAATEIPASESFNSESSVAGTPVPVGYPTTEIYTNPADGSEWAFEGSIWQEISSPTATAATAATLTATASVTPNWFTESTIWSAVPNGVLAGGAALVFFLLMRGKR